MVYGTLTPAGLTQASGETATGTQQTTFDAMTLFMGLMTDPFIAGRGDILSRLGATPFADESGAPAMHREPQAQRPERDAYAMSTQGAPPA